MKTHVNSMHYTLVWSEKSRDSKRVFAKTIVLLLALQHIVSSGRDVA
jgi:hypothetical protein